MSRLILPLTILCGLLLQVGVAPHIALAGIQPNFLLLGVATIALVKGPRAGLASGFVAGLLSDLVGTGPVGAAALIFCVVGFVAGSIQANMFAEGWFVPLIIAFAAALSAEAGYMALLAILGEAGLSFGGVLGKAALAALYTSAAAFITYPWVARFLRWERPMNTFRRLA